MDQKAKDKRTKIKQETEVQKKGKVYDFVVSENWKIIRNKLINQIIELDSLKNTPDNKCDRQHILARQYAVDILFKFLGEVEGEAREYIILMNEIGDKKKQGIILNLEEDTE